MSITIVATAGSASANSFVTEAEAIAYVATRLNASAWTTVTGATCTESEKVALIESTREISAMTFKGSRTDSTQVLSWPRQWVENPDSPTGAWDFYASTAIPSRVKDATCELALQFLKAGTTDLAAVDPNAGVIEKTVDVLTTRWDGYRRPTSLLGRFPSVARFLKPLLEASGFQSPVVRG